MKLNLLNLLKGNALKASANISPAPESTIGKGGEFKRALADAQGGPPPIATATTKIVEPPVEKSAVLISKRYSKSHVETQRDIKESVKFDSADEKVAQVAPQIQGAPQTAAPFITTALRSDDVQSPREVKHVANAIRIDDKAATVPIKYTSPKTTLTKAPQNGIANGEAQYSGKRDKISSPFKSRTVVMPHRDTHSVAPYPDETFVTRERVHDVPRATAKPQIDNRVEPIASDEPRERSAKIVEQKSVRAPEGNSANVLRDNGVNVKQEIGKPKQLSAAKSRSEAKVSSESVPQKGARESQAIANPSNVKREAAKGEALSTENDSRRGTNETPLRRDTSPVENVIHSRRVAPKEAKIESPIKEIEQGTQPKANSEIPPSFAGSPRSATPDPARRVILEDNRPQVVQRIWSSEIEHQPVKPAPLEKPNAPHALKPLSVPIISKSDIESVESAFVRPTLEAKVFKQPTLAQAKMSAAVSHREAMMEENTKQPELVTKSQVFPQHKVLQGVTEPSVREQSVPLSTSRTTAQVEVPERPKFSKDTDPIGEPKVSIKKASTPVVFERLQPLERNNSMAMPFEKRHATSDPALKGANHAEVKHPETKNRTVGSSDSILGKPVSDHEVKSALPPLRSSIVTVADANQSKPVVNPEVKGLHTPLRGPITIVPELEFTKQADIHLKVNERAREIVQPEPELTTVQPKSTSEARGEIKTESRLPASNHLTTGEDKTTNVQTSPAARLDNVEAPKETPTSTRAFKPIAIPESLTLALQTNSEHITQAVENFVPRVDTNRMPEFTRYDRTPVERDEQMARSTQERPQQVSESKANEQPNQHGQDAQTPSRERETGQPGFRQSVEQTAHAATQTPIPKPNQQAQGAANEALKLALQKALDQSRKRMIDPDELRMSIPFGELGTMDIDIVREDDKFSIRIAADPQAIALMEDQRVQLTQWLRVQGYPVEKLDVAPRYDGEQKSNLTGSQQPSEERESGQTGRSGRPHSGGGGVAEERGEAAARPAFSGLRVWTA